MKVKAIVLLASLLIFPTGAKEYLVYSVTQELPMGEEGQKLKKNYYVNMGEGQGLRKGILLDVFRSISRIDSHDTKKGHTHKVKIARLKVIHVEEGSAIAMLDSMRLGEDAPLLEIPAVMVGDMVSVQVD